MVRVLKAENKDYSFAFVLEVVSGKSNRAAGNRGKNKELRIRRSRFMFEI